MNYSMEVKHEPSEKLLCEDAKNAMLTVGGNFGENPFNGSETVAISEQLNVPLARGETCTRPGPGGARLTYIEGWKVIQQANMIFGFNGWSSKVISIDLRYLEETAAKRFNCCVCATVRITLRDGAMREDRGGGVCEGMRSKGDALLKAEKEAVTDATKRALKNFGLRLGLSLYDRKHVREMNRNPAPPPKSAYAASPVTPAGPRRPISAHSNQRTSHVPSISAPKPSPPSRTPQLLDSERPRANISNSRQPVHAHQPTTTRPPVSRPQFTHPRAVQPKENHGQSRNPVGGHFAQQHSAVGGPQSVMRGTNVQQHNTAHKKVPPPIGTHHRMHQRGNHTSAAPQSGPAHLNDSNQINAARQPIFPGYQHSNHDNRVRPGIGVTGTPPRNDVGYTLNGQHSTEMPVRPQISRQLREGPSSCLKRPNSDVISPTTQQRRARAAIVEKEIAELNSMGLQNFEQ